MSESRTESRVARQGLDTVDAPVEAIAQSGAPRTPVPTPIVEMPRARQRRPAP